MSVDMDLNKLIAPCQHFVWAKHLLQVLNVFDTNLKCFFLVNKSNQWLRKVQQKQLEFEQRH